MNESDPVEVKKVPLGKLTTSVEGLRKTADWLEKNKIEGNFITEHFIVTYNNNVKTIGIQVPEEVLSYLPKDQTHVKKETADH